MKNYYHRLFNYNQWANQQILNTLQSLENVSKEILGLMSHNVAVEQLWLARLKGQPTVKVNVFPVFPLEDLLISVPKSSQAWHSHLESLSNEDVEKIVTYSSSEGKTFSFLIHDFIIHTTNHSNYHRAQINKQLRQEGHTPVQIDYLYFAAIQEKINI